MSTGFPASDARDDFLRARRRAVLARLASRLRREPDDIGHVLPLEEVVQALGLAGEQRLGLHVITLDSIIGTVDRTGDFDRRFRPTHQRLRGRWERIAAAQRRGEAMPPISVYRVGELHFVEDGHHRVSVAKALGLETIDAYVTKLRTTVGAGSDIKLSDLPLKSHERVFFERVPLPADARADIELSDPWHFGDLAENVEAWGFRLMQESGEFLTRAEVAEAWLREEYRPVVAMLREADMIGRRSPTEAYMDVACERYRLLHTHEWSEDVLERLRGARR